MLVFKKCRINVRKALAFFCFSVLLLTAGFSEVKAAVAYGGSGTVNDPYIVETAEQLQGMRENLSASYKLSNTIDLTGTENFKPVGNLENPFTGTFTCDLGSDGYPLYAIKNLKITVAESTYSSEKKNRWEAGLFGATSGAEITNIFVIGANVVNNNIGNTTGGIAYGNYKPGMDEMNCAALIGDASSTTVKGCMSSGNISGSSNWMAGLIGRAYDSDISYSYSTANVTNAQGYFGTAGFIGDCSSTVSYCFASGNVQGGGKNATVGGFIGQSARTYYDVSNCYCTGSVSNQGFSAASFAGYSAGNGKSEVELDFKNCWTSSNVTDYGGSMAYTDGFLFDDSYVLSSVAHPFQKQFKTVSESELLNKFSSLTGWDVQSAATPVISDIKILTDARAAEYVPGAVTAVTSDTVQQTVSGTEASSGQVSQTVSADELKNMIDKLPVADKVTEKDIDLIADTYISFKTLSDIEQEDFDAEYKNKLTEVVTAAQPYFLVAIKNGVEKLPAVSKITSKDKDTVTKLYKYYQCLNDEALAALNKKDAKKLLDAYDKISGSDAASEQVSSDFSTLEIVLIAVLSLLICFAIFISVFFSVKLYRLEKKCLIPQADENEDDEEYDIQKGND